MVPVFTMSKISFGTKKGYIHTLFPKVGELLANHVSCNPDWQCAKHEFKNTPFCCDPEKPCTTFTILFLNPAYLKLINIILVIEITCWVFVCPFFVYLAKIGSGQQYKSCNSTYNFSTHHSGLLFRELDFPVSVITRTK